MDFSVLSLFDECTLWYKKHHLIQRDKTKKIKKTPFIYNVDKDLTLFKNDMKKYIFIDVTLFTSCQIMTDFDLPLTKKIKKLVLDGMIMKLLFEGIQIRQMLLTHRLKLSFSQINMILSYFSFYQLRSGRPVITALQI